MHNLPRTPFPPRASPPPHPGLSGDSLSSIRILILKTDRVTAAAWRAAARSVLPRAEFQTVASATEAAPVLERGAVELLMTGFDPSLEGDVLGLLTDWASKACRPTAIVLPLNPEPRLILALHRLRVHAVFDVVTEGEVAFASALQCVAEGGRYWSPSICDRLAHYFADSNVPLKRLTTTEQLVLSVVGDGSDDMQAAERLGMNPSTIAWVRRNLHRKLNVQHRGDLVRVAAQNGFVCFTHDGVVRPGFASLLEACRSRRRIASQPGSS